MTDETAATEEVEIEDAPAASDGDDATETTESAEVSTEESTEDSEEKAEKPKRANRGVQKRIDKLTKQLREQERLIEELRTPREEPKSEPKRENYEDYEAYLEDRAIWKVEQRLAQEAATQRERQQHQQAREQQATTESRREDIIDAGVESFPDFEEVAMTEDLAITQEMADAILQSDAGHELWYHLGKHPAKAQKIASLPSTRQILELGRLEASLKSAKLPSNAPPPTKAVGSRAPVSKEPSARDSISTWMEKRNRQLRG